MWEPMPPLFWKQVTSSMTSFFLYLPQDQISPRSFSDVHLFILLRKHSQQQTRGELIRREEASNMAGEKASDVKVLGAWPSPYVMRPRIALNLKGVPYEFVTVDPHNKSEILVKSNPVYKKIPVLLHGDLSICESLIIVEYIDKCWNADSPSILPKDAFAYADARFWAYYIDDKWFPAMRGMASAQTDEAKAEAFAQFSASTKLLEEAFAKCSNGKGFFGGESIGYVDIALGSLLGWVRASEAMSGKKLLDVDETPLLSGWADRFCAEDAVKSVMPETEKLVEFAKAMFAKKSA